MSAVQHLRAALAADHDLVDAAFGRFDLADGAGYARFLLAHARALPAVEAALDRSAEMPPLRARTPLLASDLAALGHAMPRPLPFFVDSQAAAFGAAYVIEGSRLGGGVLRARVPEALPTAYLSAIHLPGEWRGFLKALDDAARDEAWITAAIASGRETFALYRNSAAGILSTAT